MFLNLRVDVLELLEDHLAQSLKVMETQYETIKSIVAWDWIIDAYSIGN